MHRRTNKITLRAKASTLSGQSLKLRQMILPSFKMFPFSVSWKKQHPGWVLTDDYCISEKEIRYRCVLMSLFSLYHRILPHGFVIIFRVLAHYNYIVFHFKHLPED